MVIYCYTINLRAVFKLSQPIVAWSRRVIASLSVKFITADSENELVVNSLLVKFLNWCYSKIAEKNFQS